MSERTPDDTPPPKKRTRAARHAQGDVGNTTATGSGSSVKAPARGRAYTGKLAGLMHMPMDIFFEIASHLHPLDLLHVSRTSKQFRSVVLSRKTRFVWIASLANVEGLPPCPDDMTEPVYAALLFDRICNLCGAARPSWVDYAIRLRLCKSCYKDNVKKGQDILPDLDRITQRLLMAMTPCETGKDIAVAEILELPLSHKANDKYYVPQLEATTTREVGMKKADESVEDYLNYLVADSVKIHQHATKLLRWEMNVAAQRQDNEESVKARRKASIIEKLKELGFDEADFPKTKEWSKLVDQPKELTDRIWNNIQPKLEILLQEEKERRVQKDFESRVKVRLDQISAYYEDFVAGIPEAERSLLPNLFHARQLPCLAALAREDDAEGEVAQAAFTALVPQMLQDIEAYKTQAKEAVVAEMKECSDFGLRGSAKAWKDELAAISPEEAMTRHYALFRCSMWAHPEDMRTSYLTFEQVHDHWRTQHPNTEWGGRTKYRNGAQYWSNMRVFISGDYAVGGDMLDAVGLPRDTPLADLNDLVQSGRLYCSCGDPALPPPEELDWPKLFEHVYEDVSCYRRRLKLRSEPANAKLVVRTQHTFTGPDACIKLLPEGADTAPARERASALDAKTRTKIEERLALRPTPEATLVCRICKAMTARRHLRYGCRFLALPDTPEGIVHHLRAWHDKDFEKRDILFSNDRF